MMKRLNIVLIISLICALAAGCSNGEIQTLKEQNASLKKQVTELEMQKAQPASWDKAEEFDKALKLLDEFVEENGAPLGIAKNNTLQLVKLDKVTERYYLAEYMIEPLQPLTNNFYTIIDMEKESCSQINLDTNDYISEITYDMDFIVFHCDGNNVMNGFRDFPHDKKYDIAKNEVITEYPYKSLQRSETEIRLGNVVNKAGLGKVIENNKSIQFSFEEVDGTVLAGGMFCPTIKTGLMQNRSQEDRTLYIDFEALVLSKEAQKQIMDLKELEYISDISIRSYKDVHDKGHVVVYLEFKDVEEYSCRFQEDSSNGFMDLLLMLK